jgi:hypothetical protein
METFNRVASDEEFPSDVRMDAHVGRVLRLYALLSPAQREALRRGDVLSVARMTPAQRAQFVAVVRESHRDRPEPLDPAHVAGGNFSLTQNSFLRIIEPYESGLRFHQQPIEAPKGPAPAAGKAEGADAQLRTRVNERSGVVRYPMTTLLFTLKYGPQLGTIGQLSVRGPL